MTPTSDELEAYQDRVIRIDSDLAKISGEVRSSEVIAQLAALARDWLRLSSALKEGTDGFISSLDEYDLAMSEILKSTKGRSRATAYKSRLKIFRDNFMDAVLVPIMRHEGSPAQAAARRLESLFAGVVSHEEAQYIAEAARCSSVKCQRAAMVIIWAAAIARLHSGVQVVGFAAFNSAAAAVAAKKGHPFNRVTRPLALTSVADLQLTRDFDVIGVGMELWQFDLQAFEEINRLLGIRNSAAHPGTFEPTSLEVWQFAEKVKRYIFDVIALTTI